MTHADRTIGSGPIGGDQLPGTGRGGGLRGTAGQYALLPLRLFLGITFIYAGLDKLTDKAFLDERGPGSLAEQLNNIEKTAAIQGMIDLAQKNPQAVGWMILLGELAVGLGTLFGLLARVAATGGALISLSLWLTVSWAVEPYYYGNDLIYLMAWLPLILAGAPYLSLDALLRGRRRRYGQQLFG
ncbi:DoxX family protein [Streptomyces boninensis]|uniref:DoxX family protein n=1 Tax=Streptomyces boninensis TaxID=2039455 RepID=UPI003B20EA68